MSSFYGEGTKSLKDTRKGAQEEKLEGIESAERFCRILVGKEEETTL